MNKKGRLYSQFYRNGEQHRGGADVSFSDIVKIFGFKSAQIGNWVNKEEQQIAANLFFDAFSDLMDILSVPARVISLNGSLSISFGVGGKKHACAHYNSAKRQLALAKNAGGGALAHEWFHAFDHYICQKLYQDASISAFATEMWLNDFSEHDVSQDNMHPLNKKLIQLFVAIFLDKSGTKANRLVQASIAEDKKLNIFYFARPQEIAARAFEAAIESHDIKNAFLVQTITNSQEAVKGLYPIYPEQMLIQIKLLDYFNLLGQALRKG